MTTRGKRPRQPDRVLDEPRETRRAEVEEMAARAERSEEDNPLEDSRDDPNLLESAGNSPDLPRQLQDHEGVRAAITAGYQVDPVLSKVWNDPGHHAAFRLRGNLLYTDNRSGEEVLCVPHAKIKGDTVIAMIIAQAHQTLGHLGAQRTADYIRRWYWWPKLGREVDKYCRSCPTCLATKTNNRKPLGLLHSLPIPT